ncbi:unnamed protein product [Mytilus coruscus]|uniref:Uncharacterized protein n=1 Tax=Mytilus coruscus TaxID=42192 RepID=A0A6J8B8Z6_MYTCO|nr:unnamed protein product [Mytilus coruscus]
MRIGDVLLRNLIENAINMDQKENLGKRTKSSKRVDQVVELIRSCGISFSIWENKVKDGRGDSIKNLDWTSPTRTEFKKILHLLPEKLRVSECVPENARDSLSKLWADFYALYSVINAWSPSDEQIDGFFGSAQKWVSDFTSLRVCLEGFDFKYVTPYMHILVYHVSFFLRKYRSIKQFIGQGVEKCNDDIKMIYHRKSNNHDSTAES